MTDRPVILVDTREQCPLHFSDAVDVEICTLPTGDYSIRGYSDRIVIERKAPGDLWQCTGSERARFEGELARLQAYPLRAVVIESTIDGILATMPRGRVQPRTVIRSTIAWSQDFGIPMVWAGNPQNAACWVEYFLTRIARKAEERAA
ncbi:MAG: hypothetical protein JW751_28510 [Polyangiaceae bacterium]|nr:hypothetical protein [Polyangiaceae bacterium]